MTRRTVAPINDHVYVVPINEEYTPGGIALPASDNEEPQTRRGLVFAYSAAAARMVSESLGPDRFHSRWFEGAEIEYYGHSTTKIDGDEFHVIRVRDIWAIIGEAD